MLGTYRGAPTVESVYMRIGGLGCLGCFHTQKRRSSQIAAFGLKQFELLLRLDEEVRVGTFGLVSLDTIRVEGAQRSLIRTCFLSWGGMQPPVHLDA